jgi:hypothetical protein
MQPDAVPASEIVAIFRGIMEMKAVPIYRGGAADAQRVRRLYPTPAYARSTVGPLLPH